MKSETPYRMMLARKFFWMPKLPVVSGEDFVKVLSKQGFTVRK
jgi:hypothetical protein